MLKKSTMKIIGVGGSPRKGNTEWMLGKLCEELGGKIEFMVGGEKLVIDKTSALFIPKGIDHGPLTWKSVEKPHIQMVVMPGAGTVKESNPVGYIPNDKKK
jgi:hypothetical protein